MPLIKGYLTRVTKYRIVRVFIFLIVFSLIFVIIFSSLGIIPELTIFKDLASMMGILAALFSSLIALLLPFILRAIEVDKKFEKRKKIRLKCYNAINEICDFCIRQIDIKKYKENGEYKDYIFPKEKIEVRDRLSIITQIETLDMYRKEALEMGIVISGGWAEPPIDKSTVWTENSINIYIFIGSNLEICLVQYEYGKVMRAELKYKDNIVHEKEFIQHILKDLHGKIDFDGEQ